MSDHGGPCLPHGEPGLHPEDSGRAVAGFEPKGDMTGVVF